jgi:hypothetical protein
MYADDIIMLAGSISELEAMHRIASKFARQHRFQYNGTKSGVMVFNASPAARRRAVATKWTLFGEKVEVKQEYEYLGTITTPDFANWTLHVKERIRTAEKRSRDLLWICRHDRGMRPHTAVTLWQSMVRPMLEYASEFWTGLIPAGLEKEAEKVQLRFLRGTLGLHKKGSGVSNDVVRAETGCEPLRQAGLLAAPVLRRAKPASPPRRRVPTHRARREPGGQIW